MSSAAMTLLFPETDAYHTGFLTVSPIHKIYYEQSGNPDGQPILVLHGGPGDGSSPKTRRYFNPDYYRIIQFDQRGCGQSTPFGELEGNTTADLVADIEALRHELGIEHWLVTGTSWGSTLALLYAQAHPRQVEGMILRSIFLGRQKDIDWVLNPWGAGAFFPAKLQNLMDTLGVETTTAITDALSAGLRSNQQNTRHTTAVATLAYELCLIQLETLNIPPMRAPDDDTLRFLFNLAKLLDHYHRHHFFMEEGAVLNNIHRLRTIPAVLIHGQYDLLCPAEGAYTLHQHWPGSELHMIREAGHSGSAPRLTEAFMDTLKQFEK